MGSILSKKLPSYTNFFHLILGKLATTRKAIPKIRTFLIPQKHTWKVQNYNFSLIFHFCWFFLLHLHSCNFAANLLVHSSGSLQQRKIKNITFSIISFFFLFTLNLFSSFFITYKPAIKEEIENHKFNSVIFMFPLNEPYQTKILANFICQKTISVINIRRLKKKLSWQE